VDAQGDGILNEAYERLHKTGPEFRGWLANHGPMAVESLVAHELAPRVHRWLDGYVSRLEELPHGASPINADNWREALGDPRRLGDWLVFFDREMRARPWRAVLATWWPRLLPGIAAGATHGVIRAGHAVRALLRCADGGKADGGESEANEPRSAELGQALGYWAARWQPVPGATAPSGIADPARALDGIPRVPDQDQGIGHRLEQLIGLAPWAPALAALQAAEPAQVRDRIAGIADAAAVRYLTYGHGSGVMLVHAVTAPTAVLRTLPALPTALWAESLNAAWAASAAVTAAYTPAEPAPRHVLPDSPTGPDAAQEVFVRAVEHGDEHVIKLADACADVYGRAGNTDALAAAIRSTTLIRASV
jgi:hypothetical protein